MIRKPSRMKRFAPLVPPSDGRTVRPVTSGGFIEEWHEGGMYHRDDGPARMWPSGDLHWYRHGQIYNPSPEEVDDWIHREVAEDPSFVTTNVFRKNASPELKREYPEIGADFGFFDTVKKFESYVSSKEFEEKSPNVASFRYFIDRTEDGRDIVIGTHGRPPEQENRLGGEILKIFPIGYILSQYSGEGRDCWSVESATKDNVWYSTRNIIEISEEEYQKLTELFESQIKGEVDLISSVFGTILSRDPSIFHTLGYTRIPLDIRKQISHKHPEIGTDFGFFDTVKKFEAYNPEDPSDTSFPNAALFRYFITWSDSGFIVGRHGQPAQIEMYGGKRRWTIHPEGYVLFCDFDRDSFNERWTVTRISDADAYVYAGCITEIPEEEYRRLSRELETYLNGKEDLLTSVVGVAMSHDPSITKSGAFRKVPDEAKRRLPPEAGTDFGFFDFKKRRD